MGSKNREAWGSSVLLPRNLGELDCSTADVLRGQGSEVSLCRYGPGNRRLQGGPPAGGTHVAESPMVRFAGGLELYLEGRISGIDGSESVESCGRVAHAAIPPAVIVHVARSLCFLEKSLCEKSVVVV